MDYTVYVLYSEKLNRYYKGFTKNLNNRIKQHNSGSVNYTSKGIPWILVLSIHKKTKQEAMVLERKLKNLNRIRLMAFIEKYSKTDWY
ncbi:GIY-YIG nuclease family protein [Hanstruepera flava]|uniref:GIY-YIG nuclease family protein n=1 Tax=Hanstruepera flava TaxID=2930218 RepID=UPI0020281B69|nr:GIY-YIG nuclease family protein [Hanstruepera flava]